MMCRSGSGIGKQRYSLAPWFPEGPSRLFTTLAGRQKTARSGHWRRLIFVSLGSEMVSTDALFRIGDAAEEAGNFEVALQSFERGAVLGDVQCLCRLAYLFDVGRGVEVDKAKAMRLYRRAWQQSRETVAATNIAVLYREQAKLTAMFRWWKRAADAGDGSAYFEMAKCYLEGHGVKKDVQSALRCLSAAVTSEHICEEDREGAEGLLNALRPCLA